MKTHLHRAVAAATFLATVAAAAVAARGAPPTPHKLGEHPAVIAKRLSKTAGYDYAAQFYPHPAWLYLRSGAAEPLADAPPVAAVDILRHSAPGGAEIGSRPRAPGAANDMPRQAGRHQMVEVPFTD